MQGVIQGQEKLMWKMGVTEDYSQNVMIYYLLLILKSTVLQEILLFHVYASIRTLEYTCIYIVYENSFCHKCCSLNGHKCSSELWARSPIIYCALQEAPVICLSMTLGFSSFNLQSCNPVTTHLLSCYFVQRRRTEVCGICSRSDTGYS